jgi:uncharacterized DUF497 family protein
VRFVWDEVKDRLNRSKHKVSFETARAVFDDPFSMSVQDRIVGGEERWRTLGLMGGSVVLLVAHTYVDEADEEIIRIISARKATARERKIYAQGIEQPS